MIPSTQLRVGNLYDHSGRVKKVTPIVIEALFESERIWCKAIPLTEEWLLNFGFEKMGGSIYKYIGSIEIGVTGNKRFYIQIRTENVTLEIKYVHQLQNLYFALTNKELNYETTTI